MKKILPILLLLITNAAISQTVSIRLVQTAFSGIDPDGAGPAKGSVTIQFELMTSSGTVLGDGLGLSFVYQSALLIPTPTNTTTAQGPIASSAGWTQQVDNRLGTDVNVNYGGQTFDKRMIITFNQSSGLDNASFTNTWTPVAQVTYWTLGTATPEGGYSTPEDGTTLPQNSLSSDGGLTSYDYLSPAMNAPIPLGSAPLPVVFTKFDAHCTNSGSVISWATESESNSNYYELERSIDGNSWTPVARIKASGTTSTAHTYQQSDVFSGTALYKIKQVDLDGHFTYTSIISSNCEFSNLGVVLYPVPARDLLNVIIQSDKAIKTKLYIIDVVGKVVQKMDVNLSKGNNTFPVNLKGLASGEYILNSSTPGIQLNKKFNVIR